MNSDRRGVGRDARFVGVDLECLVWDLGEAEEVDLYGPVQELQVDHGEVHGQG